MPSDAELKRYESIRNKIKLLSNIHRFRIIVMTQDGGMTITQLSSKLKLSYTKCADYVALLAAHGLVSKKKDGRNVFISSNVRIRPGAIVF